MKTLVIGAVGTTALTIKMLHKHNFDIIGVLGHEPNNPNRVSGLNDLSTLCLSLGIDYMGYQKINEFKHLDWARSKKPDLIFAVGFSQLLNNEWLNMSTKGCIGFHPTVLPDGRGRAPVAWTILEGKNGAANFFLMGDGADDGPIFVQQKFELTEHDDAESFVLKLRNAITIALDEWLPKLKSGEWNPKIQDNLKATYFGKREPCDSLIDWNQDANSIDRLIKASTHPHSGSFTFFKEDIITIWKSRPNSKPFYKGVVGRILLIEKKSLLVQCGMNSSIWIDNYDLNKHTAGPMVGDKFGTLVQNQIDRIINNFVWKKDE